MTIPHILTNEIEQRLQVARASGDASSAWPLLEDAHVLSQPWWAQHVRVHLAMLLQGVKDRDLREIVGQIYRIFVAAPGSWSGRYPQGNTGRARIRTTMPMPIRKELSDLMTDPGDAVAE